MGRSIERPRVAGHRPAVDDLIDMLAAFEAGGAMLMAAVEPDFHACRQRKCVQSVEKSVEMTIKGGKNGKVGGFGGYNAVSVFSGGVNQAIMPSKRGR